MSSPAQFSRRMIVLGNGIEPNANRLVRGVALIIDRELVLSTPVDKGVARSNWLVSIGVGRTDVVSAYAPGNKLGRGETANAAGAMAQGAAVIGARSGGQSIFIVNNVPYIETLNNGYSKQAPAGFVQLSIQRAIIAVRNNPSPLLRGVPLTGSP